MARIKKQDRDKTLENTRQRLLDGAVDEFARAGYVGANINTMSSAAGYAKGTIYNYFPSKRDLMLALVETIANRHLDFVRERVVAEPNPARQIEQFFRAGFDFVAQHLSQAHVMLNTVYGPDEELKAHAYKTYQPMFQLIANEILRPGIEQGLFRPVDPASMATLLMTIYLATASQVDPQGHFWLEPDQVTELALNGLLKSP